MQILVVKGLLLFVLGSGIIIFRSRVVNHMEINRLRISQSVRQGIKLRFMAQLKLRTKS
jgi:branched-subunit amino acid transport protein